MRLEGTEDRKPRRWRCVRIHPFPVPRYWHRALYVGWAVLALALRQGPAAEVQARQCREQETVQNWLSFARDPGRQYQERITSYERAIQACHHDASLYRGLAELLLGHYQFDAALRVIEEGLKSAPNDTDLNLDRAAVLLLRGQPAEALPILRGMQPSGKSEYYTGLACRILKDHRAAQKALRHAWELGYHDPFLLYALVEQDRMLKDYEWSRKDYQTLRAQYPSSPWLHMAAGDSLKARQLRREAEAEYKKAQKSDPNLPFLNHRLGSIAYGRGDYTSAADYFRKEIALNPTYPAPYVFLGVSLHRLGKNPEALPFLRQGLERAPDAPLAYLNLAIVQMELGRSEQARFTLEAGEKRFPDQSIFPAKLSSLLSRMGRHEEAKVQASLAQELGRNGQQKEKEMLGLE
jgi:tetratricopeptide (TPR) repeat protein